HGRVISETAEAWGLRPQHTCQDTISTELDLWQIPQGYDFPRDAFDPVVRYVGPIRGESVRQKPVESDAELSSAIVAAGQRPIVFASFGTLFGGRHKALLSIAQGIADTGCQAVIADGGRLTEPQVDALAETGAIVRAIVPQRAVLSRAAACVTHGGMNTTMDALEAAVPLLACPIGFDQKANAARIVWHGAGVRLSQSRISRRTVAKSVSALLDDRTYPSAARRLSNMIKATGGRPVAADMVTNLIVGAEV
ncbi:MAG: glycosyltransferase, partial [Pseudomonadota bacterium]